MRESAFYECPKLDSVKISKKSSIYGEELKRIKYGGRTLKNNLNERPNKSHKDFFAHFERTTEYFTLYTEPSSEDFENIKRMEYIEGIFVPKESVEKYSSVEEWSEYKDIIYSMDEY